LLALRLAGGNRGIWLMSAAYLLWPRPPRPRPAPAKPPPIYWRRFPRGPTLSGLIAGNATARRKNMKITLAARA
jgi:hypothetical protein